MDRRSLLVILSAVVAAAIAAFVVNAVDSVLLALASFLLLPLLSGTYAAIMSVPWKAGTLLVLLSIASFFFVGALVSSGDPGTSVAEEIAVYAGLGLGMTFVGLLAFAGMTFATANSKSNETEPE